MDLGEDNVVEHVQARDDASDMEEDDADAEAAQPELVEENAEDLRKKLEQEQATVRALAREGISDQHPAMLAALAARDAAEESWKAARKPHPVARRMGWAQRRLDRALRARDKVRDEMSDFEAQVKEQRDQIGERLDRARERVAKCQKALEDLQEEAATEIPNSRKPHGAAEICSKLAGGMRSAIAPHVAALASTLAEGSPAHEQFNLLVAQLEGLQGELDQHAEDSRHGHEAYWISDGHSEAEWSESHDLPGQGACADQGGAHPLQADVPRWTPKGHGRWDKDGGASGRTGKGTGQTGGTPAPVTPVGPAAETSSGSLGASSQRAPARAREGDGSRAPTERTERHDTAAGRDGHGSRTEAEGAPPSKLHKGQEPSDTEDARAAASNTTRALELMQAQQGAAAAGGFGSQAAIQAAAHLHSQNVAKVTSAAIAQGVQPLTSSGEDLLMLGPQELEQWASANLDRNKGTWW